MSENAERQALHVGLALVAGLAVIGFFVGTGSPPEGESPLLQTGVENLEGAPPAKSYRELRSSPPATGTDWSSNLAKLSTTQASGATKEQVLAQRASRRAYDGAPPTVPHPVRQQDANECMSCHEEGLRARGRLATPIPHDDYRSCTQCHVVSEGPAPGADYAPDGAYAGNTFVGIASPTEGPRAWSIAPPQMPHQTQMRGECMSCHGPMGQDPLQSTHTDRQSCEQCHAASAKTDLRPGLEAPPWQTP